MGTEWRWEARNVRSECPDHVKPFSLPIPMTISCLFAPSLLNYFSIDSAPRIPLRLNCRAILSTPTAHRATLSLPLSHGNALDNSRAILLPEPLPPSASLRYTTPTASRQPNSTRDTPSQSFTQCYPSNAQDARRGTLVYKSHSACTSQAPQITSTARKLTQLRQPHTVANNNISHNHRHLLRPRHGRQLYQSVHDATRSPRLNVSVAPDPSAHHGNRPDRGVERA